MERLFPHIANTVRKFKGNKIRTVFKAAFPDRCDILPDGALRQVSVPTSVIAEINAVNISDIAFGLVTVFNLLHCKTAGGNGNCECGQIIFRTIIIGLCFVPEQHGSKTHACIDSLRCFIQILDHINRRGERGYTVDRCFCEYFCFIHKIGYIRYEFRKAEFTDGIRKQVIQCIDQIANMFQILREMSNAGFSPTDP